MNATDDRKPPRLAGGLVMVGFGCIGQGVLPLLLRHIDLWPSQITIISPEDGAADRVALHFGVQRLSVRLTEHNFEALLRPWLGPGDFLLNLSVDVSSAALIGLCQRVGAVYLDTCLEPWAGGYLDQRLSSRQRTNGALRDEALALRRPHRNGPTALLTHGANPGLVSHFVKQGLLDIAQATDTPVDDADDPLRWPRLAHRLGIKVIHIAERDTQVGSSRKQPGEFVNTWSVDGFVGEGCQPAELGWGSHERHFPADGRRHPLATSPSIYLERPGAATRVRSWTPLAGPQHAYLIAHGEAISIAECLTLTQPGQPDYRPTVHYAYRPCDDAMLSLDELAGRNWQPQSHQRILKDDIVSGVDELGVLLMGSPAGAYWYGSRLSIEQARALAPFNSATSLQVTAAVMAGVVWVLRNPQRDVVEPDDLPFAELLALSRPYLGDVFGEFTTWTPLQGRGRLFAEDLDETDPWQFKNFRVA